MHIFMQKYKKYFGSFFRIEKKRIFALFKIIHGTEAADEQSAIFVSIHKNKVL